MECDPRSVSVVQYCIQGVVMIEAELTDQIIGAAIDVHKHWGPGLLEDIYERSMCHELHLRNIAFDNQSQLPLMYKGVRVGDDLRLDFLVENKGVWN